MSQETEPRQDRVHSVDVMRGFALLGILIMNIVSFGMPFASYVNPAAMAPLGSTDGAGPNLTAWLIVQTLFEGKMRALFSMLFGTSAILMLARAEQRGAGIGAADIYYRRTLWLILFGLLHAHLIWYGDILYAYGLVGLLLFPLRNLRAKTLIVAGAAIVLLHSLQNIGAGFGIAELKQKAEMAAGVDKPSLEQKKAVAEWGQLRDMFQPSREALEAELKAHRGGWIENLAHRAGTAALFEFTMFFQFMFLDVLGMLLLGMGLAKAGVFDAALSYRAYAIMAAAGFVVGIPLNYLAASAWHSSGFDIPGFFSYLGSTADPGRLAVAFGYIGIVMSICKCGCLGFITATLGAVGRMALSNYLLTSIIFTFYFNGYGAGMFNRIERWRLFALVPLMWAFNLAWSSAWLRHYRFGPAEWLWRSLTYWRKQPMRLAGPCES